MTPRRVTDPAALRAMAQPLRLRLYYALVLAGSATATSLADGLDVSVSLVSYHLRQLAAYGYVEPDSQAGADRRERWWRPSSIGFSWRPSDLDNGPDGALVAAEAARQLDAHRAAYRQQWWDSQAGWDRTWRDAAISTDNPLLRMTASELAEFGEEFHALLESWRRRLEPPAGDEPPAGTDPAGPAAGREQVMIVLHAFPFRP